MAHEILPSGLGLGVVSILYSLFYSQVPVPVTDKIHNFDCTGDLLDQLKEMSIRDYSEINTPEAITLNQALGLSKSKTDLRELVRYKFALAH